MVITQSTGQNSVNRLVVSQGASWPFVLISGFMTLMLAFVWFDYIVSQNQHPLYSGTSILLVFLASLVILAMGAQRKLVPQLLSLVLSFFYTQRVIVTYFVPDDFTYNDYRHFSIGDIESAALFYFLSVVVIFVGYALLGRFIFFFFKLKAYNLKCGNFDKIKFFLFSVDFLRLAKIGLWIFILGSIFQIYQILNGFGSKGFFYQSDQTLSLWLTEFGAVFGPFVMFSLLYFPAGSKEYSLAKKAFFVMLLIVLARSTKGSVIGLLLSYYLISRVLNKKISPAFYKWSIFGLLVSILIFFPAMTVLRNALNDGSFNFDSSHYVSLLPDAFLSFSNRLGAFDWMTLWSVIPQSDIPANASILGEIIEHINSLVIGDLIDQEPIMLSKLMVVLGHGYGEVFEFGGHAENLGGLATAMVFFERAGGLVYLTLWAAGLYIAERLNIHPFHKTMILSVYIVTFIIGGGAVLIHSSYRLFLVLTTMLVAVLSIISSRHKRAAGIC